LVAGGAEKGKGGEKGATDEKERENEPVQGKNSLLPTSLPQTRNRKKKGID